jgi:rSAM/selenodomain-associated transferase 1
MKNKSVIVIMAKQPRPGMTKTRLSPPLTVDEAARLYEVLLLDTIQLVSGLKGCDLAIAITPEEARSYFEAIALPGTLLLPVDGVNIGDCLSQSLRSLLSLGYTQALALNADGPSLPVEYLQLAIDLLDEHDLTLGPGHDGGYYLIGVKRPEPALFRGVSWSTPEVLTQTLERVRELGWRYALTPQWYDIDTAADLVRLVNDLDSLPQGSLPNTRAFLASSDVLNRLA